MSGRAPPKDLRALLAAQKAKLAVPLLPPHDPNAPPSPTATLPGSAPPKLPKGFTDGIMGAVVGHAADNLLSGGLSSPKSGEMGLGFLLLGGLGKILAASVKDTNPELSATLDSMATGAVAGAAFKAAAKAAADMRPEPLIEEAQKAVEETQPHLVVEVDGAIVDPSVRPQIRAVMVTSIKVGAQSQFIDSEPLVEEAEKAQKLLDGERPR